MLHAPEDGGGRVVGLIDHNVAVRLHVQDIALRICDRVVGENVLATVSYALAAASRARVIERWAVGSIYVETAIVWRGAARIFAAFAITIAIVDSDGKLGVPANASRLAFGERHHAEPARIAASGATHAVLARQVKGHGAARGTCVQLPVLCCPWRGICCIQYRCDACCTCDWRDACHIHNSGVMVVTVLWRRRGAGTLCRLRQEATCDSEHNQRGTPHLPRRRGGAPVFRPPSRSRAGTRRETPRKVVRALKRKLDLAPPVLLPYSWYNLSERTRAMVT